jgi:hypothetical protein
LDIPEKSKFVAEVNDKRLWKTVVTHLPGHLFVDFWMGDSVQLLSLLFILKKGSVSFKVV